MPRDPEKARARKRRYLDRRKVAKYGPGAAGKDMRGRHSNHARGDQHARWNNSRIISEHGYVKVRVGRSHPLADPNGYAYEHLVVWLAAGNPMPKNDELLHHKNEIKSDNRIENLELVTRSHHATHHNAERGRNELGRFKKAAGRELDGRTWA